MGPFWFVARRCCSIMQLIGFKPCVRFDSICLLGLRSLLIMVTLSYSRRYHACRCMGCKLLVNSKSSIDSKSLDLNHEKRETTISPTRWVGMTARSWTKMTALRWSSTLAHHAPRSGFQVMMRQEACSQRSWGDLGTRYVLYACACCACACACGCAGHPSCFSFGVVACWWVGFGIGSQCILFWLVATHKHVDATHKHVACHFYSLTIPSSNSGWQTCPLC
jgi:hypothetical protein